MSLKPIYATIYFQKFRKKSLTFTFTSIIEVKLAFSRNFG